MRKISNFQPRQGDGPICSDEVARRVEKPRLSKPKRNNRGKLKTLLPPQWKATSTVHRSQSPNREKLILKSRQDTSP
jgi:hypothetical protein